MSDLPGAPTHPDYARLSALLAALSREEEDTTSPQAMLDFVAQYVDPVSLLYTATHATLFAFGIASPEEVLKDDGRLRTATALFQEAFILGLRFQQERTR